ncbi:MAG TPA: glycosyltransferase family 1 protein, partial [Actinomycetota bacterium]|nr:glycosyltransferase family 1 protein [Actinomycetota bacterium]
MKPLPALQPPSPPPDRPGGVLFLNWRDTSHPEGGGSEVYVQQVAAGLAAKGRPVTLFCAAHQAAPSEERSGGVRIVRRGSRLGVYLQAWWAHLTGRLGEHEVVVDVQNGLPFFSPLGCRRPVVVLVHHVHREQWRVVLPAL